MGKAFYTTVLVLLTGYFFGSNLTASNDMTLQEIISKHIDAYGGESKWKQVEALEIKGRFTAFSETAHFYTLKTDCGNFFSDYNLGKHRIQEWHDGSNFYTIDPWQGLEFPRKINKAERHVIMQKAEFFTPFFRWEERGLEIELMGTETIDGIQTWKLLVTRPGMQPETWFLDAQTLLVYKSITPWIDFATAATAETFYDDYRKTNGILLPHYIETTYSTRHITTEIEQVTINPEFNPHIFAPPTCKHLAKIEPLIGSWNVKVEYMTRAGSWHVFDKAQTTFESNNEKRIEGPLSYELNFPATNHYTIHYNHRSQLYQLVVYNDFYSTTDLFEGTMEQETLVFQNIPKQKDPIEPASGQASQPYFQFIFNMEDNNRIILERNRSTDNGATWQQVARYTFSNIKS